MASFYTLLAMCGLMFAVSLGMGILPLSVSFSRTRLAQLSTFGVGLLLGAGLGVVIPEGIESVTPANGPVPTHTIALALLGGFAAMLAIEQVLPAHSHAHHAGDGAVPTTPARTHRPRYSVTSDNELDLDLEIELLESSRGGSGAAGANSSAAERGKALPLSLGLVIHCAADGIALGASSLPTSGASANDALPLIVFLALVIHKAPTALALSTSLLSAGLNKPAVRRHLLVFSAASPLSALATWFLLNWFGGGSGVGSWTGVALLASGGSFLYVATVLQPVSPSHGSSSADEITRPMRILLIVAGMFTPLILSSAIEHGHAVVGTGAAAA
ncbi:Zinc/iron permease [Exidia glandulosa HHB12029]|uniref:Zinc/iron permease n=1 Tax=Exidia glandulosa HHB12029 TaxID=1314781 RepID=A0A165QBH7_EXIGL|nr:Zinc/iron permease [Exidia glandulosa HHB12029]